MASEYLKMMAQRSRERRKDEKSVIRSTTIRPAGTQQSQNKAGGQIGATNQSDESPLSRYVNQPGLTAEERTQNAAYGILDLEANRRDAGLSVWDSRRLSGYKTEFERQPEEKRSVFGDVEKKNREAERVARLEVGRQRDRIPYTTTSDAGKIVKTGDKVKIIKPGEEDLHQGDVLEVDGRVVSGKEYVSGRYADMVRPFFENEDYTSDAETLFAKYGDDAIPRLESALEEWKQNKAEYPAWVQAEKGVYERSKLFEKQLRKTLTELKKLHYTEMRKRDDFAEYAQKGATLPGKAAEARNRLNSQNQAVSGAGLVFGDYKYAALTEDERAIYNYLLAKEGEDSAEAYLHSIEDSLNARFGKAIHDNAESLENPLQRAGLTAITSVGAGVHDFGTGIHQNFTDEPPPRAPLQHAADIYGSELEGASKFAFDAGRTVGNMAPSIAASAAMSAVGLPGAGLVSSGLMGLSSAGNSYREAVSEGYSPEDARQYAAMSGLSEAGTTYLLGGISKLGGKLTGNAAKAASARVTNGALRFAADMGVKMTGEGVEEVLQNELDLLFRNMILGEENDLNPLTAENAYTFLMAATTAGFLEGGSTAVNAYRSSQLVQAGRSVEASGQLNALLHRSLEGSPELRTAAERVIYAEPGDVNGRNEAIGRLFLQYAGETGDAGLILRAPTENETLNLPTQEPLFQDDSHQKYKSFRPLPLFDKKGNVINGAQVADADLPRTKTGESETVNPPQHESQQEIGDKADNGFFAPIFHEDNSVTHLGQEPEVGLPGVQIVENQTVESGAGIVHDVPKGAVGTLPDGVKAYTPEQAQQKNKVRDNYISHVISSKQGLKDFWNRITGRDNNGAKKETAYLGLVTPEMGKVYEQVVGQDLTNFSYSLDSDLILHVNDEHGVDGRKRGVGEIPVNEESFGEILDILQHPDEIYDGGVDEAGHKVIITVRRSEGTTAYVQWVQENNKGVKRLNGKTFFMTSEDMIPTWENSEHKAISWVKNEQKKKTPGRLNSAQSTPPPYVQNVTGPSSLDTNISQSDTDVNNQYTQGDTGVSTDDSAGAFGDDSVDAARPLTTEEKAQRYDDYVREHGAISMGENPARDVQVPRKTGEGKYTRRGARTFMESGNTPEAMVNELKAAVVDDLFAYERLGNKQVQDRVDAKIARKGFENALADWDEAVAKGKPDVEAITLGETLYTMAAQNGDLDLAVQLAAEVSEMATEGGRVVQAMRMMKKATPAGKLYSVENTIKKLNEKYKKRIDKGKMQEITLSNELRQKLLDAKTTEAADAAMGEIEQHVAEQLPSTVSDRVDALRYFAMLSNPKTHIRNLIGNVAFGRAVDTKDVVGAVIERLALPEEQRTKSILTPKDKALRDFATHDYETVKEEITGTGKMNPVNRIEAQKKIFKHEALNKITGLPGELLELSDGVALRGRYAKSLAGFLKARGITAENIGTEKGQRALSEGRKYAIEEARKATFRDTSKVANTLSQLEKKNLALRVIIGGTMPFKKTPINVMKRGVEYSPVGLAKGAVDLLTKVRNNEMSVSKAIDEISAGMTGTGLSILGYWLGSMGFVSLGGSEDDKERGFDALQGKQNYALNIGGHSYTLDWLSPAAMPFFVGAELQSMIDEGTNFEAKDIIPAISKIFDPVLEMSFMSGLQDSLESASYGDYGGAIANFVLTPFTGYPTQFIPSALGSISRMVDPTRRSYYAEKDNPFPASAQKTIQKSAAKIPFFSQTLEPYVDQWGREEVNDSTFGRLVENFVSPGYYSEWNITEVDKEIERLYAQTGEKSVLPAYAPDDVTQDKTKYNMTAKEHTVYAKTKGQTAYNTLAALLDTADYRDADDTEKLKYVSDAYTYASQIAKKELLDGRGVSYTPDKWVTEAYSGAKGQKGGKSIASAIGFRRTLMEAGLNIESYDKVRAAQKKMGISYQDYADVYSDIAAARKKYEDSDLKTDMVRQAIYQNKKLSSDQMAYMSFLYVRGSVEDADAIQSLGGISYSTYADFLDATSKITAKDENGNTVNGLAKRRKEQYINSLPLNNSQKELLTATISTSKSSKAYIKYRIEVAPITREDKAIIWDVFFGQK